MNQVNLKSHPFGKNSILSRLFWAFFTSSLIIISITGILYYEHERSNIESRISEQVETALGEVVALFKTGYQTRIEGSLSLLESSPAVNNFLHFQHEDPSLILFDIEKQFTQLIKSHPELYRTIRFVDAFGKEIALIRDGSRIRHLQTMAEYNEINQSHTELKRLFKNLKSATPGTIIFSDPFKGKTGHNLFYAGISKLEPEIGGFGGAIIFECKLDEFIKTIGRVRTYGYDVSWIIDGNNNILVKPSEENQPKDPRPYLDTTEESANDIYSQTLVPGNLNNGKAFLRVVLSIPSAILEQQMLHTLSSVSLIAAFAILFTSFFAWWVSRQITRPITELVKTSQQVEQGNFDARSNIVDKSEIGILSNSFNSMTHALKKNMSLKKATEEALHQSYEAMELVLNSTAEGIFGIDNAGICTFCNRSALDILGYAEEDELIGLNMHDTIQKYTSDLKLYKKEDNPVLQAIKSGQSIHREFEVFWRSDNTQIPVEYRAHPIMNKNEVIGSVVSFTDITTRQQAEIKLRTLSQAVEQSPVSVVLTDLNGKIEYYNSAFQRLHSDSGDITGTPILELCQDMEDNGLTKKLWKEANESNQAEGVFHYIDQDNQECWSQIYISPVKDENDNDISYLVLIENITERKQQEDKITHQAHHDMLTGLPNRFLALDRLGQILLNASRNIELAAVLFIDLDGFKKVNDLLGHDVGDQLLIEAARRLKNCVREQDTVGRLGGDEFIVLLGGLKTAASAQPVAENILKTFREPFHMDEHDLLLTASIGIALYPSDAENPKELLRNADIAMYESKRSGRNTYHFFTEELNAGIQRRLEIEEQLHNALENNEFYLLYQPILDIKQGKITGAETLIRWNNHKLGLIGPDEFIPIAEQTGLITSIGDFVLRESIKKVAEWREKHNPDFTISVNASPRQFHSEDMFNNTKSYLEDAGLNGDCLQLELTEGVLMSGHKRVESILNEFHNLNIHIVMDDFGTGYSSLSYLRKYPFDKLKIDRSFISDLLQTPADKELVIASLSMAHGLGLKVVAEGIETQEQLAFLRDHGCDYGQGYLVSKPVHADEFETRLLNNTFSIL